MNNETVYERVERLKQRAKLELEEEQKQLDEELQRQKREDKVEQFILRQQAEESRIMNEREREWKMKIKSYERYLIDGTHTNLSGNEIAMLDEIKEEQRRRFKRDEKLEAERKFNELNSWENNPMSPYN